MITYAITPQDIERARELNTHHVTHNNIDEEKILHGGVAEVIAYHHLKYMMRLDVAWTGRYSDDMLVNGYLVDVKSYVSNFDPQPHYYSNIPAYRFEHKIQHPDFYLFAQVSEDLTTGFCTLIGFTTPITFASLAEKHLKGEEGVNGFVYKADTYDIRNSHLWPLDKLYDYERIYRPKRPA